MEQLSSLTTVSHFWCLKERSYPDGRADCFLRQLVTVRLDSLCQREDISGGLHSLQWQTESPAKPISSYLQDRKIKNLEIKFCEVIMQPALLTRVPTLNNDSVKSVNLITSSWRPDVFTLEYVACAMLSPDGQLSNWERERGSPPHSYQTHGLQLHWVTCNSI